MYVEDLDMEKNTKKEKLLSYYFFYIHKTMKE